MYEFFYYAFVGATVLLGIFGSMELTFVTLTGVTAIFYVLPLWGHAGISWSQLWLSALVVAYALDAFASAMGGTRILRRTSQE